MRTLWQQAIVRYIICAGASVLFVVAAADGLLDKTDYWTEPVLRNGHQSCALNGWQSPGRFHSQEFPPMFRFVEVPRDGIFRAHRRKEMVPLGEYLQEYVGVPLRPTYGEIWDTRFDEDELTVLLVAGLLLPALIIWRKSLSRISEKLIRGSFSLLRTINSKLNKWTE